METFDDTLRFVADGITVNEWQSYRLLAKTGRSILLHDDGVQMNVTNVKVIAM